MSSRHGDWREILSTWTESRKRQTAVASRDHGEATRGNMSKIRDKNDDKTLATPVVTVTRGTLLVGKSDKKGVY